MKLLHIIAAITLASPAPAALSKAADAVRAAVNAQLDAIEVPLDIHTAHQALSDLFDATIAHASARELDAIAEAAFGLRLTSQLSHVPGASRLELLQHLRAHDDLARTIAFLIDDNDDVGGAYRVLADLLETDPRTPEFASLACAIAVVHETPLTRAINENRKRAPLALDLFDYFADNADRLPLDPRNVPAELLVYVVDACASIDELRWALANYDAAPHVGRCFFEIQYDYDHYRTGAEKKVTASGDYSLPNIKSLGGVCADQAHYAMTVGKACGIPTAYVVARGADVSHAWVGFLETTRSSATWNFDFGRYEAYKGLRGNIVNPQTHQRLPDGYVAMLARHVLEPTADRRLAVALTDAAQRLAASRIAATQWPPPVPEGFDPRRAARARQPTAEAQLELLEAGLRASPAHVPGWLLLASMANDLTHRDKQEWAETLDRLSGRDYPDFSIEILEPMIASVDDPRDQSRMWDWAAAKFRNRPDLIARIRLNQGQLGKRSDRPDLAWNAYNAIIEDHADDGPFVVDALLHSERLLREEDKNDFILPMYESAWKKTAKPDAAGAFTVQSNWHRIGRRYLALLIEAGDERNALDVGAALGLPGK